MGGGEEGWDDGVGLRLGEKSSLYARTLVRVRTPVAGGGGGMFAGKLTRFGFGRAPMVFSLPVGI